MPSSVILILFPWTSMVFMKQCIYKQLKKNEWDQSSSAISTLELKSGKKGAQPMRENCTDECC